MLCDELLAAYDRPEGPDESVRWRSFCIALLEAVMRQGGLTERSGGLAAEALRLWREGVPPDQVLVEHRVAIWNYLEKKNGSSVFVRDPEDRGLRAVLGALWPVETRDEAAETAYFAQECLTGNLHME